MGAFLRDANEVMKSIQAMLMLLCACLAASAPARAGEFQEAAAIGDADKVMTMLIAHPAD